MNNFFIIHTKEHNNFKEFIKKKKGSINISYIDILNQQEKYLLFGESKNNSVLECELFNKIYDSIANLHNPKYHTILYYMDTLDLVILEDFISTLKEYDSKLQTEIEISLCDLDNGVLYHEWLKNLNINLVSKEFIQQIF